MNDKDKATRPVAWMVVNADGALSLFDNEEEAGRYAEWAHGPRPVHPLYTAPPDQSERIAALEAALEQARVALENVYMAPLVRDALRAIEEVRHV